jgi:hypothetical protein
LSATRSSTSANPWAISAVYRRGHWRGPEGASQRIASAFPLVWVLGVPWVEVLGDGLGGGEYARSLGVRDSL